MNKITIALLGVGRKRSSKTTNARFTCAGFQSGYQ